MQLTSRWTNFMLNVLHAFKITLTLLHFHLDSNNIILHHNQSIMPNKNKAQYNIPYPEENCPTRFQKSLVRLMVFRYNFQ